MISRNFFICCTFICLTIIISGFLLFSINNEKLLWTQAEEIEWLNSCSSIGRDKKSCDCMLAELQDLYPSKKEMNLEMKNNPAKFSEMMTYAKGSCN